MSAPPPAPRTRARQWAVAAGLFLAAGSAAAQPGPASLRLRVTDAATGQPVRSATATLLDGVSALTDDGGTALLEGVAPGARVLEVSHMGYETARVMARVAPGAEREVAVRLVPRPVALDPMVARAPTGPRTLMLRSFYARASSGPGHYITREQIARARPRDLSDLFRVVPGMVLISVGSVSAPRVDGMISALPRRATLGPHSMANPPRGADCPILYFLDGTPIEARDGAIDLEVDPEEVEGIEIYRRGSTAPAQYQRGDNCGIVLIWKREQLDPPNRDRSGRG